MSYKPYKKEFTYSYTLGVFPTIELLQHSPQLVDRILLHSSGATNQGIHKIITLCKAHHISYETNDKLVNKLATKENSYAVGVFYKQEQPLSQTAPHIVLVQPSDMGNLGTIMRTALGFGIRDIAIVRPAADAFDPKVVRGSMGAFFQMRIQYFTDIDAYMEAYSHAMYTFRLDGAKRLQDVAPPGTGTPYALVFGNESAGLPAQFCDIGIGVVIPHSDAIDSMNLAVAVGIATYHFTNGQSV